MVFVCLLFLYNTPLSTSQKKVLGFGVSNPRASGENSPLRAFN